MAPVDWCGYILLGIDSSAPLSCNSCKFHYFSYQFVGLDANFLGI